MHMAARHNIQQTMGDEADIFPMARQYQKHIRQLRTQPGLGVMYMNEYTHKHTHTRTHIVKYINKSELLS